MSFNLATAKFVGTLAVLARTATTANLRAVPSYWRFDGMATYRINKKVDLQLNVQNIFNRTYYDQAYPAHYASIAAGRSAFLTLNAHY